MSTSSTQHNDRRKSKASRSHVIHINQPDKNKQPNFPQNNRIKTSKYSLVTFLPKNLYEQFRRVANLYFLVIAVLQLIPGISPVGSFTTIFPLSIVLIVTAVKEGFEDYRRHLSDNEVNHLPTEVLRGKQFVKKVWQDLVVGDIVRVHADEGFPADLVLLNSSEVQGMCYVATTNLDGETNLKLRQASPATTSLVSPEDCAGFRGTIEVEHPNNLIYVFHGVLNIRGEQPIPLTAKQLLLRGSVLRNTDWVYGVVVYIGDQTKLMKNSTAVPSKRSTLEKKMNSSLITIFALMLIVCSVSTVASMVWTGMHWRDLWYLAFSPVSQWKSLVNFLTFIITFSVMIPISLYVSLEMVRVFQALLIGWDAGMYDEESDTIAKARTSNLSEELGQVQYVFADKTGTLTRNHMEFVRCAVGDGIYNVQDGGKKLHSNLRGSNGAHSVSLREFFTALAVCHSVVPEVDEDSGDINYQAASPDEGAFIATIRRLGFMFKSRSPEDMVVEIDGVDHKFELLNMLEFSSDRKRMSVIVRDPNGKIKLYCKGADSTIFPLLRAGQDQYADDMFKNLEHFASDGLRTLCVASAELDEAQWSSWNEVFHQASVSLEDREKKMDEAAEQIEKDLVLLGVTGIEDKLQDAVPEIISKLKKANIHVWVLTGDKRETAINIGFACQLLDANMDITVLTSTTKEETRSKLEDALRKQPSGEQALVIEGFTLTHALTDDLSLLLLELASRCSAVICVRATPLQKAQIVRLVRQHLHVVTLAIGDGANDVSMIRAANVGVGISGGVEGNQAVMASDYSVPQFRFIYRLLMVHGRWDYLRNCKLITYCFYKNIVFALTQFWFAFLNGFSAQTLYDGWSIAIYNVLFTGLPVIAVGMFEQDVPAHIAEQMPQLYCPGQQDRYFNLKLIWRFLVSGIFHSIVIFFVVTIVFGDGALMPNGQTFGLWSMGAFCYAAVVAVVNLRLALDVHYWTWVNHLVIWGCIAMWFGWMLFYSTFPVFVATRSPEANMYQVGHHVVLTPAFWLLYLLIPALCLLPNITHQYLHRTIKPTEVQIVQEKLMQAERVRAQHGGLRGEEEHIPTLPLVPSPATSGTFLAQSFFPPRSQKFTGYAFSHEAGARDALRAWYQKIRRSGDYAGERKGGLASM